MGIVELATGVVCLRVEGERPQVRGDYDGWAKLTRAERETVTLAAQGLSNQAIAERRGTALRTVANQLAASYRKLQIASRRELSALYRSGGLHALSLGFPTLEDVFDPGSVFQPAADIGRLDRALTRREQQVLAYAEIGHSNKLIAYSLGVAISTVSTLLARARRKLRLHVSARRQSPPAHSLSAN